MPYKMLLTYEREYINAFGYEEGEEILVVKEAFENTNTPRRGKVTDFPFGKLPESEVPIKLYNPPTQANCRVFDKVYVRKIAP